MRMPIATRRGKIDSSSSKPEPAETNMASPDITTNPQPDDADPDVDSVTDRKLLLQILSNQKSSEKKSEERFSKLTKQVNDAKSALDLYQAENDQEIAAVKTSVNTKIS